MTNGIILKTYLAPRWRLASLLLSLLLIGAGLQLLSPFVLARFIDSALAGEPLSQLMTLAIIFLLITTFIQLGNLAESYVATNLGFKATNDLREDLALHCLNLDMSFHNSRTPGELIDRIDGDVGRLSNFFSRFVVDVFGNSLLLLGVLTVLFTIDWRIGLALTAFVTVMFTVIFSLRNVGVPFFMKYSEANAKFFGFLEERLTGTEDVRPNGGIAYVLKRFFEHGRSLFYKGIQANLIGMGLYSTSMILFAVGAAISLGLGAWLFQSGFITLGTVFVVYRYTELLTRPIEVIGRQIQDLQQAGASVLRVEELLGTESKLKDDGQITTPSGPLDIQFQHVSFHYPDETRETTTPVLKNISFTLDAGKKLGLLGRTGSGKTTLTRLIFRFFDPVQGHIYLNNNALQDLTLDSLHERVAMVTQDIQLFHASLRNNLSLFRKDIADDDIITAIQEVGLGDWYSSLDQGLDTLLTPSNTGLSAGQGQLLAFARVFLKNPGLIILDEASSRLDPATELQLEKTIQKLLAERTAIIIAHRLKTIDYVDDLLILDQGQCIEYGEKELLETSDSRFSELLKTGLEEALV